MPKVQMLHRTMNSRRFFKQRKKVHKHGNDESAKRRIRINCLQVHVHGLFRLFQSTMRNDVNVEKATVKIAD